MQIKKPNLTFLVTFNCVPLQGVNGVFFWSKKVLIFKQKKMKKYILNWIFIDLVLDLTIYSD